MEGELLKEVGGTKGGLLLFFWH